MHDHEHHEDLIKSLMDEYGELLENSEQAIYIYLDDQYKVCNQKFAKMLGYKSASDWAKVQESFTDAFVAEKSQATLVTTYSEAMELGKAAKVDITWKQANGKQVDSEVILTPIVHSGHLFALHFVTKK